MATTHTTTQNQRPVAAGVYPAYGHERMRRGPWLEDSPIEGAKFVVIPSDWYNYHAVETWKALGFKARKIGPDSFNWIRLTSVPFDPGDGKGPREFSPTAWLKLAREKFYDFFRTEMTMKSEWVPKEQFVKEGLKRSAL